MADRLILCSKCGSKNRVGSDKPGRPTCGNCGKPLAVNGHSGTRKSAASSSFLWFLFGTFVVIGIIYYYPGYFGSIGVIETFKYQSPDSQKQLLTDEEVWAPKPVRVSTGVLRKLLLDCPTFGVSNNCRVMEWVAPLSIQTSPGFDYFVKLVTESGAIVMEMYIKGGEQLNTSVPIGTFELRYAAGNVWYGEELLFGKETAYSKTNKLFHFEFDGSSYNGYTVELIMQRNGNLPVSAISASDF